jgi:hypothetical protein
VLTCELSRRVVEEREETRAGGMIGNGDKELPRLRTSKRDCYDGGGSEDLKVNEE